jgi:GH24 family phage-related lysozyme (muramidase)
MYMSSVGKLRLQNREKKMMRYYDDLGKGKGNCTVGYGHKVHSKPCTAEKLARKVTEKEIMGDFDADVRTAENAVNRNVKVPLTQEQFDALVSYTFNRGSHGAQKAFALINSGDLPGAAAEISSRTTASGQTKMGQASGLFARRTEESAPFRSIDK